MLPCNIPLPLLFGWRSNSYHNLQILGAGAAHPLLKHFLLSLLPPRSGALVCPPSWPGLQITAALGKPSLNSWIPWEPSVTCSQNTQHTPFIVLLIAAFGHLESVMVWLSVFTFLIICLSWIVALILFIIWHKILLILIRLNICSSEFLVPLKFCCGIPASF